MKKIIYIKRTLQHTRIMIIGLMGTMGSGKTLAANYLASKHNFVEFSFAQCLKKALKELFLLSDEQLYGTQAQKEEPDQRWFGCSSRRIMQYVGTELLRNNMENIMPGLGKNIFIHHFRIWYDEQIKLNPELRVVISDVRFQNEADVINCLDGKLIKIARFSQNTTISNLHESEVEMSKIKNYHCEIINNQTIDYLFEELDKIIS